MFWSKHGYQDLANCMRYVRLQCPYEDESFMRPIYMYVCEYNIPCLLLFAFYIRNIEHQYFQTIIFY